MRRAAAAVGCGVLACATVLSAIPPSALRSVPHFAAEPGYNPINDIKGWRDKTYFMNWGDRFVGSHSSSESVEIALLIQADIADAPARARRVQTLLIIDGLLITFAVLFWLGRRLKGRSTLIREASIEAAAASLRTYRDIKTRTSDLAKVIDERSKSPKK